MYIGKWTFYIQNVTKRIDKNNIASLPSPNNTHTSMALIFLFRDIKAQNEA